MTSRVIPRPDGNGFDTVPAVVVANPTTGAAVPDITRGSGPIDANTQRVTLATDDPGVAALASIDAKTPALISSAQPVIATPRTCLGTFRLSVTSTAATLPALVIAVGGAGIPAGAVVCELQADGGTVRIGRFDSVAPTTTTGYRLDDGAVINIDSTLSHVRLIASSTTPVNCTFFDRV